jgi:hypothetical protein
MEPVPRDTWEVSRRCRFELPFPVLWPSKFNLVDYLTVTEECVKCCQAVMEASMNEHKIRSSYAEGEASHEGDKWLEFQRDLETFGHQISELWSHKAVLGDHVIQNLEAQYQKVRIRADAWKNATELETKLASRRGAEAQGTFSDMRARSKATAFEMWERAEPLREGARDVGEGLVRAWGELRASFGKAANRLSSSEAPDSPSASDQRDAI